MSSWRAYGSGRLRFRAVGGRESGDDERADSCFLRSLFVARSSPLAPSFAVPALWSDHLRRRDARGSRSSVRFSSRDCAVRGVC